MLLEVSSINQGDSPWTLLECLTTVIISFRPTFPNVVELESLSLENFFITDSQ